MEAGARTEPLWSRSLVPDDSFQPFVEELIPPPSPEHCCERIEGMAFRLFLDSAARRGPLGRYSFLTADPALVVRARRDVTEVIDVATGAARGETGDVLDIVRDLLREHAADPLPGLPPFQGGAAGYLGYEWGASLERVPTARFDDLCLPDAVIGIYDWVVAWDHGVSRAWLIATGFPEVGFERTRRAARRVAEVRARLREASRTAPVSTGTADAPRPHGPSVPSYLLDRSWWDPRLALRSSSTHEAYLESVRRVREYILAGDIFQANLSQRFDVALSEPAWAVYRRLRRVNPAPFAVYFETRESTVLSASPERFLRVTADGHVETRPIKGTSPRGVGPEHDAALGAVLALSDKDRAENLMIVDLMRNDLSRVCRPGTVRVTELFALERYATVYHLVSTVVGELRSDRTAFDLVRAAFPAGSITGAPKLRAMEIISELEAPWRNVYCGSIGYWSVTGAFDSSVAIRTAMARGARLYFHAGGAVVADSDPEREYHETLDKARGLIDALVAGA